MVYHELTTLRRVYYARAALFLLNPFQQRQNKVLHLSSDFQIRQPSVGYHELTTLCACTKGIRELLNHLYTGHGRNEDIYVWCKNSSTVIRSHQQKQLYLDVYICPVMQLANLTGHTSKFLLAIYRDVDHTNKQIFLFVAAPQNKPCYSRCCHSQQGLKSMYNTNLGCSCRLSSCNMHEYLYRRRSQ